MPTYNANDIIITDLTAIAAQDIFLAESIYTKLKATTYYK